MIPDYLTFIRYQDKRNVLFIYIVTFILLGFYWKNAGFSFSRQDAWVASGIFALIGYSFIADLKAFWAYKCVVKNVDLSVFVGKESPKMNSIIFEPFIVLAVSILIFAGITGLFLALTTPGITLLFMVFVAPLIIWGIFAALRHVYIQQVVASARDKAKYTQLSQYVAVAVVMSVVMNLLTISPLRNSAQFDLYGRYFTLTAIITMVVLCVVVLAINLLFLRFTRRYVFLGHLFLNEIDLYFSPSIPWRTLSEKPLWLRLVMLVGVECVWSAVIGVLLTLSGWQVWFEVYFLLCYLPCLVYYTLHTWWKWHTDFMMSSDMYLRWAEISREDTPW
ncbi:TPA: hypothetical protein ONC45_000976 [Enterobacter cloacae subsp. dissolvens]|nr:hypothetical protein [Enterobacter cloacae subsp. dissolvens]HCR2165784.1 hypothetical protein [Enterobacter cloacae subsp. dissolvens]